MAISASRTLLVEARVLDQQAQIENRLLEHLGIQFEAEELDSL